MKPCAVQTCPKRRQGAPGVLVRSGYLKPIVIGCLIILGSFLASFAFSQVSAGAQLAGAAGALVCLIVAVGLYLEPSPGEDTLAEQAAAAGRAEKEAAAADPLVRAVLDAFPGAVIEAVRPRPPADRHGGDGNADDLASDGDDEGTE